MGDGARPVIVGAAQVANKDPERLAHPVDLIEDATRLAVADAGADPLPHVGLVLSSPLSVFSDDDGGTMVAERMGFSPARTVQTTYSGAGPHKLLAEACRAIAAGEVEAALIVGGIADASVRNARLRGVPDPGEAHLGLVAGLRRRHPRGRRRRHEAAAALPGHAPPGGGRRRCEHAGVDLRSGGERHGRRRRAHA